MLEEDTTTRASPEKVQLETTRVEFEAPIAVKKGRKHYNVSLIKHCIFCLRKVIPTEEETIKQDSCNNTEWTDELQTVSCSQNDSMSSTTFRTLNNIWSYLEKGGKWSWDDRVTGGQKSTEFKSLPTICRYCASNLDIISELMDKLMTEINILGNIFRKSKYGGTHSWRAELFEKELKESAVVEYQSVVDTLEFLGIPDGGSTTEQTQNISDTTLNWSALLTSDSTKQPESKAVLTELPGVTEMLSNPLARNIPSKVQTKAIPSSHSQLDFYNEGDDDVNDDDDEDPDYIKEEVHSSSASSETEDNDSPSEDSEGQGSFKKSSPDNSNMAITNKVNTKRSKSNKIPLENDTYIVKKDPTSRKNIFTCIVNNCGKTFTRRAEGILIHQLRKHNIGDDTKKFTCNICFASLYDKSGLRQHIKKMHNTVKTPKINTQNRNVTHTSVLDPFTGKRIYTCIIDGCGKTFTSFSTGLQRHHLRHHNVGATAPVTCDICLKSFPDKYYLSNHKQDFHRGENGATFQKVGNFLKCDLCRENLSRTDFHEHVKGHVGQEYLIKCPNFDLCSFVFCTEEGLGRHLSKGCMRAVPDCKEKYLPPSNKCEICGENFLNRFGLRCHLGRYHENGSKDLPCPIQGCPVRFCVRQSVVHHIFLHSKTNLTGNTIQACDVCKEKKAPEEMERHLGISHQVQEVIRCIHCPFLFAARETLIDHLNEHRHIGLFCDICGDMGADFHKLNDLRKHYFTAHQVGKKFLCEHCDGEFFASHNLEEHVSKHHTAATQVGNTDSSIPGTSKVLNLLPGNTFKCDECDVQYKTKSGLTEHKIRIHGAERLPCRFCEEKFARLDSRNRHEREHRGVVIKETFPCQVPDCGKIYAYKHQLKHHISFVHAGIKSHVCEHCGKTFPSKNSLKKHVGSVHMGVRNHVCNVCGDSFTNGSVLSNHQRIHTGERPFACELCGQRFRQKVVLTRHLEGHEKKGPAFKPNGPMKQIRKRVEIKKE